MPSAVPSLLAGPAASAADLAAVTAAWRAVPARCRVAVVGQTYAIVSARAWLSAPARPQAAAALLRGLFALGEARWGAINTWLAALTPGHGAVALGAMLAQLRGVPQSLWADALQALGTLRVATAPRTVDAFAALVQLLVGTAPEHWPQLIHAAMRAPLPPDNRVGRLRERWHAWRCSQPNDAAADRAWPAARPGSGEDAAAMAAWLAPGQGDVLDRFDLARALGALRPTLRQHMAAGARTALAVPTWRHWPGGPWVIARFLRATAALPPGRALVAAALLPRVRIQRATAELLDWVAALGDVPEPRWWLAAWAMRALAGDDEIRATELRRLARAVHLALPPEWDALRALHARCQGTQISAEVRDRLLAFACRGGRWAHAAPPAAAPGGAPNAAPATPYVPAPPLALAAPPIGWHQALQQPPPDAPVDLENVENVHLRLRLQRAEAALATRFAGMVDETRMLVSLGHHLDRLAMAENGPERTVLSARRAGAREIDNACRTFCGPPQPQDLGVAVVACPDQRRLVALVWHAVCHYPPADLAPAAEPDPATCRANMRASAVAGLAQSIDERACQRVCRNGQAARAMRALQGYYPEVDLDEPLPVPALLTAVTCEFAGRHGDAEPSVEALRDFVAYATGRATALYGYASPAAAAFAAELAAFVRHDYAAADEVLGSAPPAAAQP